MPEHQQIQQSTESKTTSQKQATPRIQTPASHPMAIIQRARMNPKSLTPADILQLQRTIGNRAVGRLISEIRSSSTAQKAPVQRQEKTEEEKICPSCVQRQEKPEEEELLQGKFETIQRLEPEDEEKLQMKSVVQRQEISEEEDEPVQGKMIGTIQRQEMAEEEPLQTKRENNTGMPDNLKAGVENLSGIDMSDVRVHYNSSKPAGVGALAYTQGTNIHVAPGQERHLPHEAWHVVQQAQGRVRPTMQLKDGVPVNNDTGLEHEADVMGSRALQIRNRIHDSRPDTISYLIQQNGDFVQRSTNSILQAYNLHEVDYRTSPFAQEARNERGENTDYSGVNYATFWVNGLNPTTCQSDHYHSEKECWLIVGTNNDELQNIRITTWPNGNFQDSSQTADEVRDTYQVSINSVYTERQPCEGCAPFLDEILPRNADVYYSFIYPSKETTKFSHHRDDPDQFTMNALLAMKNGISYEEQARISQKEGRIMGNKGLKREVKS